MKQDQQTATVEPGVCLIDKPEGVSSFKMVAGVRRCLGIKKVGHAGTLDPFATGLLIICVGRPATRMISQFMDGTKEYVATLCLGVQTETMDTEGDVIATHPVGDIQESALDSCLATFSGEIYQTPPAFSALKHKGKPLYHYARQGIKIEKEARPVTIHELEWLDERSHVSGVTAELKLRVVCSKGTYIRTLADDIGKMLGCGAYLTALRRTKSGCFHVQNSFDGARLWEKDCEEALRKTMLSVEDASNLLQ